VADRTDREAEIARLEDQIERIRSDAKAKEEEHTKRCLAAKNQCASGPYLKRIDDEARAQRAPLEAQLAKQREAAEVARAKLREITTKQDTASSQATEKIRAADDEVKEAHLGVSRIIDASQMHRVAAMVYGVPPIQVTEQQFSTVRGFFSVFSATIISVMGSMLAIGYYAKGRTRAFYLARAEAVEKLLRASRAYYARKRKRVVRIEEKIVERPYTIIRERVKWVPHPSMLNELCEAPGNQHETVYTHTMGHANGVETTGRGE
jgi:hypothetical protein